jgi:hypothetical protein
VIRSGVFPFIMMRRTIFQKLIASVFFIASISACSAADDVLRAGIKTASRSADDAARVADDAAKVSVGAVNPGAAQQLKAFIKASGKAKASAKQQAYAYVNAGQPKIARESLWQVAYQTALSELERYSGKVAKAELQDIAAAAAYEILYEVEAEIENEYGNQIVLY